MMMKLRRCGEWSGILSVFVLVCLVSQSNAQVTGECRYAPGIVVGNRSQVEECCNATVDDYEQNWSQGRYLTTYLETLRSWNCSQFHDECDRQLFAFSDFTQLIYDYFCNYDRLLEKCFEIVNDTSVKSGSSAKLGIPTDQTPFNRSNSTASSVNSTMYSEWSYLVNRLHSSELSLDDLTQPCMQVALYEAEEEHIGEYHEVIRANFPSCEITWCGYDGDTLRGRIISAWTCMSSSCRAKMVSIMVVCGLLAVVITVVNITVILVYFQNPILLHSQGVYKVSLAFADLLVGVVVFPTFVSSLSRSATSRHEHGDLLDVAGYAIQNGTLSNETSVVKFREPAGLFINFLPRSYLNFVGFFTVLSLAVSVYSLTIAGFDRFAAVYRPLSYRKDRAKKLAFRLSIGLWLVSILFAVLPTFVPTLRYALVASILISSSGSDALILYVIAFAIPMLVMWVINALTYHSTKKHAKVRRHLTMDSKRKTQSIETRLARTLSLMVGIFTLSLIPAAVVLVTSLFISSIYFTNPRGLNVTGAIVYNVFEFAAIIILACNSLWNFFIYSARNFEFRKAVRIMYYNAANKLKLVECCTNFLGCARRVAHDGRRRISSIPTLNYSTNARKKSYPTASTSVTSERKESSASTGTNGATRDFKTTVGSVESGNPSAMDNSVSTSSNIAETSLNDSKSQKPVYTRNKNKKQKKDDSTMATDDSIFRSFAIDANADRLFCSVMENIDEEIIVDKNDDGKENPKNVEEKDKK